MPQFFLAVNHDTQDTSMEEMTLEEMQPMFEAVDAFNTALQEQGAWVFAGGLQPREATTVVDATAEGEPVVTQGPFAESREYLGGLWIIEAPDLDAAHAWAARGSAACRGRVEVRPFQTEG